MIHPTAIIDPRAEIASDVEIGAYTVVGEKVHIDSGTVIGPHVVIEGPTRIGKNNRIFQFASLGAMPQDKKYAGEDTWLTIGDNNTIREFVTFNRGTVRIMAPPGWVMTTGSWLMCISPTIAWWVITRFLPITPRSLVTFILKIM